MDSLRIDVCRSLSLPEGPGPFLERLGAQLHAAYRPTLEGLHADHPVHGLADGRLPVEQLDALPESPSLLTLREQVHRRLPDADLPDLLWRSPPRRIPRRLQPQTRSSASAARRSARSSSAAAGSRSQTCRAGRHRRERAVDHLTASRHAIRDEDIERLSPLGHEHITLTGRYRIALPDPLCDRAAYRPLKAPAPAPDRAARPAHRPPGRSADVVTQADGRLRRGCRSPLIVLRDAPSRHRSVRSDAYIPAAVSLSVPTLEKDRLADLRTRFLAIDWSFPDSTRDEVHDLHPYPAKFIGDIPAAALTLASPEGTVVDPFCGVGTTLVEAVRAGRSAIGVDLNPIATTVARSKLAGWSGVDTHMFPVHRAGLVASARQGDLAALRAAQAAIPRLDHWFDAQVQQLLAGATAYLHTIGEDDPWRARLSTAISSIVVRASRQESDTRYAAIDKNVDPEVVLQWLRRAVDRVASVCSCFAGSVRDIDARVVTGDAATLGVAVDGDEVGAAIFSPPYPNAYEYWLYHKYRMYWLGYDPIAVRSGEIGARPFYSGTGRLTEHNFARQISDVFREIASVLRPDGIVLVVVGDSVIRGRLVDNGRLLTKVAATHGLITVAATRRTIRRTRRSFNQAVARANSEHVLLFSPA